jgi:hypothetical protein
VRSLPETINVEKVKDGNAVSTGVSILGGWKRPDDERTAPYPFGYIVDFEGNELHGPDFPGAVPKNPGRLHPTLRFTTGTFYTEKRSKEKYLVARGTTNTSLGYIAEVVGVKAVLNENDKVVFKIGNLSLELPATVSAVHFEHVCPEFKSQTGPQPERTEDFPMLEGKDDMKMYYDLLNIAESMRFTFQKSSGSEVSSDSGTLRGVPPAICFGGGGSQTF